MNDKKNWKYLKSGCKTLDTLLGGGLRYGTVTAFTSEPNIGKTKLAIQLALSNIANTGKKSMIVDTEGEDKTDVEEIARRFAKRFNIDKDTLKEKFVIINSQGDLKESSLIKLMRLFGYDLKLELSEKGGKYSTSFQNIKPEIDNYNVKDFSFIAIDSLSSPLKETIGTETQNLPTRASIVQRLYGKLYQFAKTYDIAFIVNHHTTRNPITPYGRDFGKVFGGDPVLYNSKYVVQIINSTSTIKKAKFKGFEDEAKRIRLLRHPYIKSDKLYDIRLKEDWGFEDI